ncbi:hypothetical protein BCT12_08255 [Vibrio breoganii]|nr:hypothetical protein BCT12_08255 [Vibrio breoganii]
MEPSAAGNKEPYAHGVVSEKARRLSYKSNQFEITRFLLASVALLSALFHLIMEPSAAGNKETFAHGAFGKNFDGLATTLAAVKYR